VPGRRLCRVVFPVAVDGVVSRACGCWGVGITALLSDRFEEDEQVHREQLGDDHDALREMLLDDQGRADLFPGLDAELRSRPASKNVGIGLEQGVAEISLAPKGKESSTVTVAHARLESPEHVEQLTELAAVSDLEPLEAPRGRPAADRR
jgi:hypothetical protein